MSHVIRPFRPADTEAVVALWEACGLVRPWNDPRRDIARKLTVQPELFLVATDEQDDAVVGAGMAGFDGHRGWVYYVAVSPARQGERLGAQLMAEAERLLTGLGCPKINIQIRSGNDRVIGFYEHLGFSPDGALGYGKRLIAD